MQKHFKKFSKKYIKGQAKRLKRLPRHPFAIPVSTFLVLFFLASILFINFSGQTVGASDSHIVIVSHDKKQQTVPTRAATVKDLLQRLNIVLNQGDVVEPAGDTPIVEDNFRINVYRARPVTIIDGDHHALAFNAATTPRTIAAEAGVLVYPEDTIAALPIDNVLKDGIGEKVVINRATPTNLNLYGTPVVVRTHATTIAGLLKEKNVTLAKDDVVQPALNTPLTANLQIFVTRFGTQIATVEESIPAETDTVDDPSLSFGTTVVRQQGAAGKKLVTYQIDLQNGKEVGRHVIQTVTTVEPVKQIIARGKAVSIPADKESLMAAAGIASSDYAYVNYIVSRESGWCPTKWQGEVGYCPAYFEAIHAIDGSYGYGLGQATPPSKMSAYGGDWETNPVTQLRWATGYAGRYGGWGGAYTFWLSHSYW